MNSTVDDHISEESFFSIESSLKNKERAEGYDKDPPIRKKNKDNLENIQISNGNGVV